MKILAYLLAFNCLASSALAECAQTIKMFRARSDLDYSVLIYYIDNRILVEINDQKIVDQSGNGNFNIVQNFSDFLHAGKNTLEVVGYNGKFPGGHGANPGDVRYRIVRNTNPPSDITRIECQTPHHGGANEVIMFDHVYEVTLN